MNYISVFAKQCKDDKHVDHFGVGYAENFETFTFSEALEHARYEVLKNDVFVIGNRVMRLPHNAKQASRAQGKILNDIGNIFASLPNELSRDEHHASVLIFLQRCMHVPNNGGNETVTSAYIRQQMLLKLVMYSSN